MTGGWRSALRYYPLLPVGALAAIIWANTWSESYFRLAQTLAFPVNEIGVAFGLASLAQEVLEAIGPGRALSSWRAVALPTAIALGGIIGAAGSYLIYVTFTDEQILAGGWRIVCGVDVFFCVALARAVFRRSPTISVVALYAMVTDVIALLLVSRRPFAGALDLGAVFLVFLAVALSTIMWQNQVRSMWPYLLVGGPLAWFGCYWSGIHPAVALLPIVPFFPRASRGLTDLNEHRHERQPRAHFETVFAYPLQAIAFLFGLANAGVLLRGADTGTWAVLTACLVGRPAGILIAAALVRAQPFRWAELVVIAFTGSAGLVFALFLSTTVYPIGPVLTQLKLGAIATLGGGVLAFAAARILRVGRFA